MLVPWVLKLLTQQNKWQVEAGMKCCIVSTSLTVLNEEHLERFNNLKAPSSYWQNLCHSLERSRNPVLTTCKTMPST